MRNIIIIQPLIIALALTSLASQAHAQITLPEDEEPTTEDRARGPVVSGETSPSLEGEETSARPSSDDERFRAAEDESIYIVQRRAYSKKGNLELTPIFFTALNPKFVGYWGFGGALAYHLRENLSVEFMSSFLNRAFYSDLVFEVYEYEQLTPEEVDLKQMGYFNALTLQFSALYGKLEFYGVLLDYDFYATAGVGYATTKEPCLPGRGDCGDEVDVGRGLKTPDDAADAKKITGNLGGGMRIFFSDLLGLRVEIRDVVYSDRKVEQTQTGQVGAATTDIRNNVMLFLGLAVML